MASIEELLKANTEALNKNTIALEKLAAAGLGNVDTESKTSKPSDKKKPAAKKEVEEEPEVEDEGRIFFYRSSNGQLWETEDAKEIAKLRKTKGVQELDEEEYNELLEKREEELTGKKNQAKGKASKKAEPEVDEEEDELDDLDTDEEDEDEAEYDLKDAQKFLKQVKDEVGAAAVKKIFKKLGVAKFPEIKEEDATKAVKLAQAELD